MKHFAQNSSRLVSLSLVAVQLAACGAPDSSENSDSADFAAKGALVRLTTDRGVACSPNLDVTDSVNAVIAGLPSGTTLVLECIYRVDRPVRITGKQNLRLSKPTGASTLDVGFMRPVQALPPSDWPVKTPFFQYVRVEGSTAITLDGFSIRGPLIAPSYDQTRESATGVHVSGASSNVVVQRLDIRGIHGDFIEVAEDDGVLPTGVTFNGLYGDVAGRQMAAIVGADGVTIRASTFLRAARSGLDLEPSSALGVHNVNCEDSTFEDFSNFGFGTHPNVHGLTIRRSSFVGGRGLAKAGPPIGSPPNVGLVLEDVTYDWRGTLPITGTLSSFSLRETTGVSILRAEWRFNGSMGNIGGSGEVRDSLFISDKGVSPVVCTGPNIAVSGNVGAGPCP
jgi:hypothetical protein